MSLTDDDATMQDLVNRLRLLSHGSTANLAPTRGGEKDTDGSPSGELYPPHEYWGNRYNAAKTDREREKCIDGARKELGLDTHSNSLPDSPETPGQRTARMLKETAGWTPQEVAQSAWRESVSRVRALRVQGGRAPETGRPLEEPVSMDTRDRVITLDAQHCSQGQIARAVGISQQRVSQILKEHAARQATADRAA